MISSTSTVVRALAHAACAAVALIVVSSQPAALAAKDTPVVAVEVRPEYERALRRVFLSIPAGYKGTQAAGDDRGSVPADSQFLGYAYGNLVSALPAYTSVEIAVSRRDTSRTLEIVRSVIGDRHVRLHVIEEPAVDVDMWAQDLGEPVWVGGQERFLVPMRVDRSFDYNGELSADRTRIAETVFGDAVVTADFVFEGGNIAFDRAPSGLRVFIGYNDVRLTEANYDVLGRRFTRDGLLERIAAQFGAADVVVMGDDAQSPLLPHLDQAFILLGNGVAVVNDLAGGRSKERAQLRGYRAQLEALGYRTIVLENTRADLEGYRTSTNAVPFVDRNTGERKIIFPVFPGEVREEASLRLTEADLQGKGLAAYTAYVAAGYQPIPIRDFSHLFGGNTHCIANVLD